MRRPSPLRISIRYLRFLLWEFRWPLGVFSTLVLVGGLILQRTYHQDHLSFGKACHSIFLLMFMESSLAFPEEWYLQPLFFLLPIVGLGAVADSVVRLAYLIFSRKRNLPEWQNMVAALYRDHTVVVGVGTVGYQIIKGLLELREPVVALERPAADSNLLDDVIDRGVPVVRGDGRTVKGLELAGVSRARAVVLSTSDDLANLDAALTARDLNPNIRVVLRLFDESLAAKVRGAFAMPAISTAQVAAPAFVAAATGRKVYQEFQLGGQLLYLVDLTVCPGGDLVGRTVGELQADRRINVVMHSGPAGVNINPDADVTFGPGDDVLIVAPMDRLLELEARNQPRPGGDAACPSGATAPLVVAPVADGPPAAPSRAPQARRPG
jgi:voltage-gated potassium channel